MGELAADKLRHEIGAQPKFQRAGAAGLERVMGVGLAALHFHPRGKSQLAGAAVLQLVEANVEVGQLNAQPLAVGGNLRGLQGEVFHRDIAHVDLQRLGWLGWLGWRRGRGAASQKRVEIAFAVRRLNNLNRRRVERDFVHLDLAADDAPQAVSEPDFVRLKQRLGAASSDL